MTKNKEIKVKVSQDVLDLVNGLKRMGDLEGLHFPLERIEMLSQIMDEIADSGTWDEKKIVSCAFWQQKIIAEIRQQLEAQDHAIMRLKEAVNDGQDFTSFMAEKEKNSFKADRTKLEAVRRLSSMFLTDNLFYSDTIELPDLKAWALTYGFDFETVKGLLGEKEVANG